MKGDLPEAMDLVLYGHGTSCAFSLAVGHEYGLFLSREGSDWAAGMCSQVDPATLRRAAQPLPAPDGAGSPQLILAGSFGEARTIALDRELRTVSYGFGVGEALRVAVCPGARYALEFVLAEAEPPRYVLGVRRLPSFSLEREIPLTGVVKPGEYPANVRSLRCRDPAGREAVAFLSMGRPHDVLGRILVLTASGQRQIWEGQRAHFGVFSEDGRRAFAVGDPDRKLVEIELATSAVREIRTVREQPDDEIGLSPDGKTLAWFGGTGSKGGVLCVIDLEGGTERVRDVQSGSGRAAWTSDGRVVLSFGSGDVQRVEVLTAELAPVSAWEGWEWSADLIAADGRLYGFGYGFLRAASVHDGTKRVDRQFDSPVLNDLVGVPPAPPEPTPTPTPTPAATVEALPSTAPAPAASRRLPWAAAGIAALSLLTLVALKLRATRRAD